MNNYLHICWLVACAGRKDTDVNLFKGVLSIADGARRPECCSDLQREFIVNVGRMGGPS
jgi:hypothetical protein